MDDAWHEFRLNLLAYAIVGGVSLLVGGVRLLVPSLLPRLLPLPRLRPGRWGGGEVLLALFSLEFARQASVSVVATFVPGARDAGDRTESMRLIVIASPVWAALTVAIVTTLLFTISRTRPHEYGVTWARWRENVVLGILLFVVSAPVTLGVYFVVVDVFGADTNPIEETVQQGFGAWEWVLLVFMTVVGAPVTEEILFRGVLQGWLRRATLVGHIAFLLAVVVMAALPLMLFAALQNAEGQEQEMLRRLAPRDWPSAIASPVIFGLLAALYAGLLWRLGRRHLRSSVEVWLWRPGADLLLAPARAEADGDHVEEPVVFTDPSLPLRHQEWTWATARLAVFGSAMLFALFHGWPSSVPLLLLGLGLGWLAYRTQSVVGAIVCHALFNSVACIVLAWSV